MFTPEQINVPDNQAVLLALPGDQPVLVNNTSLTNAVYYGGDTGVNPIRSNNGFIIPGGTVIQDGAEALYAICAAGETATVQVIPGGIGWTIGASL
jgi:hypothetical protein